VILQALASGVGAVVLCVWVGMRLARYRLNVRATAEYQRELASCLANLDNVVTDTRREWPLTPSGLVIDADVVPAGVEAADASARAAGDKTPTKPGWILAHPRQSRLDWYESRRAIDAPPEHVGEFAHTLGREL